MADSDSANREQSGTLDLGGVAVALELLDFAEQDLPQEEMISQLLPRLSRAFAASDGLALLIPATVAVRALIPGPSASIDEVATWSSVASANATSVTLVEAGNVQALLTPSECAAVTERMAAFNCWTVLDMGNLTTLILLRVPAHESARLNAIQVTLQMIIATLDRRHKITQTWLRRADGVFRIAGSADSDRDVDQVLETIVAQTRDLLQTDCAYLSEVDETADRVIMRATSGIEDEGYKQSTSQLGETLFGAVAVSRQIICTNNYLTDPRFVHTPTTDANVSRERLQGIIAAPLQIGGRVLGVLGAANRGPINTSPERLELFRGLAHGAAIALENLRLHTAQRRLIERLQMLNELNSIQHEALKRSVSIQNQLTDLVLQGHSLEAIALRLSHLLGNPILVLGPFFTCLVATEVEASEANVLASAVAAARVTPRSMAAWTQLIKTRKPIRLRPDSDAAAPTLVVTPVIVGEDITSFVVVVETERLLDDLEFVALQQAATVFAVELTRTRLVAEVEYRLRADFVNDLVSGRFDPSKILGRAKGIGHDLSAPQVLLALSPHLPQSGLGMSTSIRSSAGLIGDQRRIEQAIRASLHQRELMAQISVIGEVTVVLVALTGSAPTAQDIAVAIARGLYQDLLSALKPATVAIGLSRVCWSMEAISGAYREAVIAMKKGKRFDAGNSFTIFEELGVERVLSMAQDPRDLHEYVENKLGALVNYDRERSAYLIVTLEAYLKSGGRLRETARAVGIHVNSLDHRLRRIEEISSVSLDDPDARLDLALALRARQLLHPSDRDS